MSDLFEGPEKKLEIILRRPDTTLRDNSDGRWTRVVQASGAAIISRLPGGRVDAYLLSESSLFVWDDRVLMITCGDTTLIDAVPPILSLVGLANVATVFYQRRRLMFPALQPQAVDFEAEAARLNRWFKGRSYRLGPANRDHVHVFVAAPASLRPAGDMTVELLMAGLSPACAALFDACRAQSQTTRAVLERIEGLAGEFKTDAHFFTPQGYSLNATRSGTYCTVHVTPQSKVSYASFESNLIQDSYEDTMAELIDVFRPDRFSLVITRSSDLKRSSDLDRLCRPPRGYQVTETSHCEFDIGYEILFANLIRISNPAPDFIERAGP